MKTRRRFGLFWLWFLCVPFFVAANVAFAQEPKTPKPSDAKAAEWIEPMRKVHARFKGTAGTFAQFGDSITVTMAYWTSLADSPKGLSREGTIALDRVKGHMRKECWREWKGPNHGSEGRMTIRWADENVATWLKKLNPEAALIMFGTNDLGDVPLDEYERKTRAVVDRCLANGTVVILSTIPPRSGQLEKSGKYATAVRAIAKDKKLPLIDYHAEILRRRPNDWDGSAAKFKGQAKDVYDVPTLISGDGVHPSNPQTHRGFSDESLSANGYALRSYMTLMSYSQVIEKVLKPAEKK